MYAHGIKITETATALTPMTTVIQPVLAIGTAFKGAINFPTPIYNFEAFKEQFGFLDDFNSFTLEEVAHCFFNLFNTRPVLFVNVLDPSRHCKSTTKTLSGTSNPLTIQGAIFLSSIAITSGDKPLTLSEDYSLSQDASTVTITVLKQTNITGDSINVTYSTADPSKVTNDDIISGINQIERVYPRLGMIPSCVIAPKFSTTPEIATVMASKARLINGIFKTIALADLNADSATNAPAAKNSNSLADEFLVVCWPRVAFGEHTYHLSTQAAALMNLVDASRGQIPYESPSNKLIRCDRTPDTEPLSHAEANTLNSQGIVTALNFNAWRLWGNRTSCYPTNDDPKDSFIACRRMMNWIGNTLAVNYFSRIDSPVNRVLVDSVLDEVNLFLSGLTNQGALLGGRVAFLEDDNPTNNLADGLIVFRVYLGLVTPARQIEFNLEFDTNYFATLFA